MNNETRRDWINYYLDIAETVSQRCTCLRRHYGAVIVRENEIISTGYVGAPRGRKNCSDMGYCLREQKQIPRGERFELCRSVHAEANAIISASRRDMLGSSLFLTGFDMPQHTYIKNATSCSMCKRLIINAGISTVYIRDDKNTYREVSVNEWIEADDYKGNQLGY